MVIIKYKTKRELKEYKKVFRDAFFYVHSKINDYSFFYRLIGSSKRNLVLEKPNKGFDLDYQIIFYQSIIGLSSKELIALKNKFRLAFDEYFTNLGYRHGEDSTSAITIKKFNSDKTIHHSYDITLISPNKKTGYINIMKYNNPNKTIMGFSEMKKSIMFKEKYKHIRGSTKWKELRDIYKRKQEQWNGEKKSFSLLMESVNEIENIK